MVSHEDSNLSSLLKAMKSLIEPRKHVTGVIALGHKVEIENVAGFSVDSEDVNFVECVD